MGNLKLITAVWHLCSVRLPATDVYEVQLRLKVLEVTVPSVLLKHAIFCYRSLGL
jgi:hypothetical protein